jgi:DNA modification methylase
MDSSPEYCDIAVKRWEVFTGKKAELIRPAMKSQAKKEVKME